MEETGCEVICGTPMTLMVKGCGTPVTLTVELQRRIQAMEMRCYRQVLHISNKDHVTNEEAHAKIQQAVGPHEDLLTFVKRCKLSGMVMSPVHQVCPKPSCKA